MGQKLSYKIKKTQELITHHFLSFLLLRQLPKTESKRNYMKCKKNFILKYLLQ